MFFELPSADCRLPIPDCRLPFLLFRISALTYVSMRGYNFSKYDPRAEGKSKFEQLLDIFMQLLTYTNGDVAEALNWMNQLDKEYQVTNDEYGMGDFIEDLKDKGYIQENTERGTIKITPKTEQGIRKRSLEEIFGKLKKTIQGEHATFKPGQGDEMNAGTITIIS